MLDLVLAAMGSFRGWIVCICRELVEAMRDLVRLVMDSWSPLELTSTWVILEIVSGYCWYTPLEVITLSLPWPPLEVGVGYHSGADVCSSTTGVGCGNTLVDSGGKDSTVRQFSKIVRTVSVAASCELHMPVGSSLRAADKKCMAWVIMSSAVTWGCVRYACKYYAVSIIISDLVLLLIAWMKR